jgi:hypothetical protein
VCVTWLGGGGGVNGVKGLEIFLLPRTLNLCSSCPGYPEKQSKRRSPVAAPVRALANMHKYAPPPPSMSRPSPSPTPVSKSPLAVSAAKSSSPASPTALTALAGSPPKSASVRAFGALSFSILLYLIIGLCEHIVIVFVYLSVVFIYHP